MRELFPAERVGATRRDLVSTDGTRMISEGRCFPTSSYGFEPIAQRGASPVCPDSSADAGAAYYQVARVPPDTALAWGAVDDREEILGRGRAEGLEVHVYGGQLRLGLQGEDTPVVVAGDGNVVWHSPAQLVQGHQDPGGDLVGSTQHGVDMRHLLQQGGDGSAGPPLGPFAVDDRGSQLQLVAAQAR